MHVFVNVAISADGKLSTQERTPVMLSGLADRERVHRLRDVADAILVGSGTVEADDPRLTARGHELDINDELTNPCRIVVDSQGAISTDSQVFSRSARTFVFVSEAAPVRVRQELRSTGATVIVAGRNRVDLSEVVDKLEAFGIDSLMIEGGGEIIASAFRNRLVDELYTYIAPRILGGKQAPTLADGAGFVDTYPELERLNVRPLDNGILVHWQVVDYP